MWEWRCVVCASTQQEKSAGFAVAKSGISTKGRMHLTSNVVPMAGKWEQSKYA